MLKKVTIRNFQTHRKASFDLDRIVTFIGNNDSGKSAVVRAIFWAAFNQPPGDEIINWHADSVSVKLEFDNCEVVRKKGKSNLYLVNGERFKAFGAGKVPDTVAKAIKMDDINVQQQLDAHFWFSDTAGTVSRQLNRVVDLSIIDSSLAASESAHRRAKQETELCRKHLKQAEETLEELSWVPTFLEDSKALREMLQAIQDLEDRIEHLKVLVEKVEHVQAKERKATKKAKEIAVLCDMVLSYRTHSDGHASLAKHLQGHDAIEKLTRKHEHKKLPNVYQEFQQAGELEAKIERLLYLVKALEDAEEKSWAAKESLTRVKKSISEETKGICPLCGSPTTQKTK